MPNFKKIARKLEERSHLTFEFPQSDNRVFRTYLPFLENPKVSEKGSSNLNEYNLIGRSSSLFAYGGANSRSINVTFKISLLNLMNLESEEGISEKFKRSFNLFFSDRERSAQRFGLAGGVGLADPLGIDELSQNAFSPLSNSVEVTNDLRAFNEKSNTEKLTTDGDLKIGKGFPHAETHRNFYRELVGQVIGGSPIFDDISNILIDGINALPESGLFGSDNAPGIASAGSAQDRMNNLIDMVYAWVNLVRSSVINNAENTVQGPPIIRLTHGAMYNNIPCIAEDYSIRIIDESGFDVQTLTPKQIEVTMSLKETRTGDFGSFKQGTIGGGDSLAGWEAILKDNNMDPYNGLINTNKEYQ